MNIWFSSDENADLSNMAMRPFTIQYHNSTIIYPSVEHFFQASKAMMAKDKESFDKILNAKTGAEAKRLGNSVKGLDSKAWDSKSSEIMKRGILESFKQNPEATTKLLATGNANLTHNQDRGKWGKEFPRILMEVRDELRAEQSASKGAFDKLKKDNGKTPDGMKQMEVDVIQKMRSYLTDLSKDMIIDSSQIDSKLSEFTQLLREENPSTNEEMEGLINKFICSL